MTAACLMTTYQPLALSFTRGLGTRLWDQQGREYLDAVAGVAVTNVGHSHPRLVTAISEQAGLLPTIATMVATPANDTPCTSGN